MNERNLNLWKHCEDGFAHRFGNFYLYPSVLVVNTYKSIFQHIFKYNKKSIIQL
jgi:hypothetical protein